MTISEFDEKYIHKGGFKALNGFKEELMTLEFIARHFEVGKEAVRSWFIDIYGMAYDPRPKRIEKKIEAMVRYAETHTLEEFKEAYYYVDQKYYSQALAEAFVRGIYKEEKGEVELPRAGEEQASVH